MCKPLVQGSQSIGGITVSTAHKAHLLGEEGLQQVLVQQQLIQALVRCCGVEQRDLLAARRRKHHIPADRPEYLPPQNISVSALNRAVSNRRMLLPWGRHANGLQQNQMPGTLRNPARLVCRHYFRGNGALRQTERCAHRLPLRGIGLDGGRVIDGAIAAAHLHEPQRIHSKEAACSIEKAEPRRQHGSTLIAPITETVI